MVIGHGNVARVLPESDLLFFASGVSNSLETSRKAFTREEELLAAQPSDMHLVYFSSLSIFYKDSPYTRHKMLMERMVKEYFPLHTIVRLGNLAWDTNPNTLIQYLKDHPDAPILDEYRYVITEPEFLHWINLIPAWSCEMNLPGAWMTVEEIYDEYVAAF